ncbi:DegV family protein [Cellulosilyticum lentocellum]|uniref:DegV family protein n=1 Tax=Cellulosilyticum lentocellum (strain ATCC 49066 / DSM 5427 / NCIMB 11756 / RHM5) TaxID=642492 RepID=F2JH90_CELLD|nr:DegV family protein [Cellulosilyticum lentocellum]ADZ82988.1 degV family protein [Cellulosilyticum lentocellum DSM 5427]
MKIKVVTDSCCDLPFEYTSAHNIQVIPLTIIMNGEEKKDDLAETMQYESFYEAILNGAMPQTAQANVYQFAEIFRKCAQNSEPVIYIGFSSALSGCVNSARMALEEVKEEYPEAEMAVVDSKCASMGLGLLIHYALKQIKDGMNLQELVEWIEANKLHIIHWFTVADLNHLFRGGRVSKAAATFGTLLQIKPVMHVDDEGRLIPVEKVKGRKKSLKALVEKLKEDIVDPENAEVFISHGGCLEEAEEVKKMILEECPVKEIKINYVGAAVGSHSGPGTMAIFFKGVKR